MLQWMGGSRRKVTTSRGSTQKRQKQYFEQRRRQQLKHVPDLDNNLEEKGCSASNNERRSLDVLSLKTLSTVAQECKSRCPNGKEAAEVDVAGENVCINASQPKIFTLSGNYGKDPAEFVSKEEAFCNPPCSNEKYLPSSNANLDPLKNDISVLEILEVEDEGFTCNFRENSMHEDHVSFSVGGLGEVGKVTPLNSPPHRMEPRGGSSRSNAFKDVEMSKNHLNDLELEVDAVIQDIDTSLSSKSSKFHYSTSPAKKVENQMLEVYFPEEDMRFDEFNPRFSGTICGKRAYHVHDDQDYKKNEYWGYPNTTIDDFVYNIQHDRPWDDEPQNEYMIEKCWKSSNIQDSSFKRNHFSHERFRIYRVSSSGIIILMTPYSFAGTEIPIDGFNLTGSKDHVFPTSHKSERSIYFEEDLMRNPMKRKKSESVDMDHYPNQYCFPVEDLKDNLKTSSEESCSSSAVRRDTMDSVTKKSDTKTFSKIYSTRGDVKTFLREDISGGHRNYVHQGKNDDGTKADTVKFDTPNVPSNQPSTLNIGRKMKTKDGCSITRDKSPSDVDSGSASFCRNSKTKPSVYVNELWNEDSVSVFPDSKLDDRPKYNSRKSRYTSHECAPCTPFFLDSDDSPWKDDLSLPPEVKCTRANSCGVVESPEDYEPPPSMSDYARSDQEMKSENHLADAVDCKPCKQKIDFFAMGVAQIEDKDYFAMGVVQIEDKEEGCSLRSNKKNLKIPGLMQSPDFGDVMQSSSLTTSDKYEYQHEGTLDLHVNGSKVAVTSVGDHKEQRSNVRKNITSPISRVLMHQSYVVQFMCVQQASIQKGKGI